MKITVWYEAETHIEPLKAAAPQVAGHSFVFWQGQPGQNPRWLDTPDLLIVHQTLMVEGIAREATKRHVPIVILERLDGAQIADGTRPWLDHPQVKAVWRSYGMRPAERNNELENRAFIPALARCFEPVIDAKPRQVPLSEAELGKLRLCWSTAHSCRLAPFDIPPVADRPIDVFCRGTVQFESEIPGLGYLLTSHRIAAQDEVNTWGGPVVSNAGARLSDHDYREALRHSRCVLSPWGFGEACWRDYEAWLSGVVVIKPDSSWVESWPDMYGTDLYLRCKPDFSDAHEQIAKVVDGWDDLRELRIRARNAVLSAIGPWRVALRMESLLRELQ